MTTRIYPTNTSINIADATASDRYAITGENIDSAEIATGSGSDYIYIEAAMSAVSSAFNIDTGAGNDRVIFGNVAFDVAADVSVDTGEGNDYVSLRGLGDDVDGFTRSVDTGEGNDGIVGSAGSDLINVGKGDDVVYSGAGDDMVYAGFGNDIINSGSGDDRIWADQGDDLIFAGAGNDTIRGGEGDDSIYAGSGSDQVFFDQNDSIVEGGSGFDSLVIYGDVDVSITKDFEAVISNDNLAESNQVTLDLTDGLIVALGGDIGDSVIFNQTAIFTDLGTNYADFNMGTIDADILNLFNEQGYTLDSFYDFQGYQADSGQVVWSDVDLV